MIDQPQIVQTDAQPAAVIRLTVPRDEIQNVMEPGINEVIAAVAAQGISPAGPWFSHHLRMAPNTFDFEVGVPVTAPVSAVGRVQAGELPAARVARTVYHGPSEGPWPGVGRVRCLDYRRGTCGGAGPLGVLRVRPGVQSRSRHLAHRAQPAVEGLAA